MKPTKHEIEAREKIAKFFDDPTFLAISIRSLKKMAKFLRQSGLFENEEKSNPPLDQNV